MDHASPTPSPIGGRSFLDPAKIRILLAPVGDVSEADFARWSQHVRNFDTLRLKDLVSFTSKSGSGSGSGSNSSASNRLAPGSPLYNVGEVHLSFVTSYDPSHSFLAPFSLHRQVLGVLGLTTYGQHSDRDALERAPGALRELHPGAVVHRVYGFDCGAARPQTVDLSSVQDLAAKIEAAGTPQVETPPAPPATATAAPKPAAATAGPSGGMPHSISASSIASEASSEGGFSGRTAGGLVIFPAVRKDAKDVNFYLRTLISELVASILDGLDGIVSSLEGTPLETPRETLDGIVPNPSSGSSATQTVTSPTSSSLASGVGTAASTAASRASALFSSFGAGNSNSSSSSNNSSSYSNTAGSSNSSASRPISAIGGGSQPDVGLAAASNSASSSLHNSRSPKPVLPSIANKRGKRTASVGGVGPTGAGRFAKVRADYHLLRGDLWAALESYDASLNYLGRERALAGGQDAVWYASALEGWAVAKVLVSRMGGEVLEKAPSFDLPAAAVTSSGKEKDRDKDKDAKDNPHAKQPWGEIVEAYSLALTIYSKCLAPPHVLLEPARSVTNETPRDFTHPLIHATACIQYARFLLAVWASAGWNGECFDQLLYGGVPPALAELTRPSHATFLRFSSLTGVQRHDVAAAASSALTQSVSALKATDQITVLSTLTSLFGCIGFSRREAYLLRQLQAVIVSLLAKAILQRPQQPTTTTLPLQCEAAKDELLGTMVSQVSYDTLGTGPEAVLVLAMQVCETHGIHVEVDPLRNVPAYHILSRAGEGLRSAYTSPNPAAGAAANGSLWGQGGGGPTAAAGARPLDAMLTHLDLENEVRFGWPEQQVALLKDTISVAEMLGDNIGMAYFAAILLRDFHSNLSAAEQWRTYQGLLKVASNARWQGAQDLQVRYWGPAEPLCSLQLVPLPERRVPAEKPVADLDAPNRTASQQGVAGLNNPFVWNPSGGRTSMGAGRIKDAAVVVAADESVELVATLQNPFAIDLDFESVRLVTDGVAFEAVATRTVAPAGSYHIVRLSGTPREAGSLQIKGVSLVLAGCSEETFLLPVYDEQSGKEQQKRAAELDDRRTRLKSIGLDARPAVVKHREALANARAEAEGSSKARRRTTTGAAAQPRYLQCRVAPCQPLLRIESSSLQHGSLNLFEGERRRIQLRLTNLSDKVAVDFVKFSFSDTLSETAKQVLAEGDLVPSDAHELEWNLLHRPVFRVAAKESGKGVATTPSATTTTTIATSIQRPHRMRIGPGASETITIEVLGKLDCSAGRIVVEYARLDGIDGVHLDGSNDTDPSLSKPIPNAKTFFTRQLTVPIRLRVQPLLECSPMEIRPLSAPEAAKLTAQSLASSTPAHSAMAPAEPTIASSPSFSPAPTHGAGGTLAAPTSIPSAVNGEAATLDSTGLEDDGGESLLVSSTLSADPDAYCLLQLDVRNVCREPVTTRFSLNTGGLQPLQLHRTIPPLSTSRFVLPCPRLSLPPAETVQPIPSLSERQFIVSKLRLSPSEERATRQRFWYRSELLSRFKAEWQLGRAKGEVALRDQTLTDPDLRALKREDLRVSIHVSSLAHSSSQPTDIESNGAVPPDGPVQVHREEFTRITARILNCSARPLKLLFRLVPVPPLGPSSSSASATSHPPSLQTASSTAATAGNTTSATVPTTKRPTDREREDQLLSQIVWADGNPLARVTPWPLPPTTMEGSSVSSIPIAVGTSSASQGTGETPVATVQKTVCFLSSGVFAFVVHVEEVGVGPVELRQERDERMQGGGGEVLAPPERVSYVSNQPVEVVVV